MHVDSWWDSYLEHEEPPKPLCIYIYSDVHTIRTSGLDSFYYMNIVPDNYNIQNILYIHRIFQNARR